MGPQVTNSVKAVNDKKVVNLHKPSGGGGEKQSQGINSRKASLKCVELRTEEMGLPKLGKKK